MRPEEAPITPAEMVEMFGTETPAEAVALMWDAPRHLSVGEVRAEIRRTGGERRREREAAEAVRAVEQEWLRLLHEFGRAILPGEPEDAGRAAHSRLRAYEAEHHAVVRALRQRLNLQPDDMDPPSEVAP